MKFFILLLLLCFAFFRTLIWLAFHVVWFVILAGWGYISVLPLTPDYHNDWQTMRAKKSHKRLAQFQHQSNRGPRRIGDVRCTPSRVSNHTVCYDECYYREKMREANAIFTIDSVSPASSYLCLTRTQPHASPLIRGGKNLGVFFKEKVRLLGF